MRIRVKKFNLRLSAFLVALIYILPLCAQSEKEVDVFEIVSLPQTIVLEQKDKPELNPSDWKGMVCSVPYEESLYTLLQLEESIQGFEKEYDSYTISLLYCYIGALYYDLKDYANAAKYSEKSFGVDSTNYDSYHTYGIALTKLGDKACGEEAEIFYDRALEKLDVIIQNSYQKSNAYNEIGNVYLGKARKDDAENKEELYEKALENYAKSIEANSRNSSPYFNWAVVYIRKAQNTTDVDKAEEYLFEAIEKIEKTNELRSDYPQLYHNWAGAYCILGDNWKKENPKKADGYYRKSIEKFKQVIVQIEEKDGDCTQCNKCNYETLKRTYDYLGCAQGKLAAMFTHNDTDELFAESINNCAKAVEMGFNTYNLACVYALKGDTEPAFHYLYEALKYHGESFDYVEKDSDWDNYRQHPRYLELKREFLPIVITDILVSL